jgi:general L-amino acid transport system permease protein
LFFTLRLEFLVLFDPMLRYALVLAWPFGVYIADAMRIGFAALPRGQYEAAAALGLNYRNAMRLVILPQVLKISMPRIVRISSGLLKATTLLSVVGFLDPVKSISVIRRDPTWNGAWWEIITAVVLMFWVFCFAKSRYSAYLERKIEADRSGGGRK